MSGELQLRPLAEGESDAAVGVHLAARRGAVAQGTMPPPVHPESDAPRWFAEEVLGRREIWVAESGGEVVGLLVLDEAFLDQLYVLPEHQGRGIGTALLQLAMSLRPGGFELWVFEVNAPAIGLYERYGMTVVERGDGSGNVEGEPDLRYAWTGSSVGATGDGGLA